MPIVVRVHVDRVADHHERPAHPADPAAPRQGRRPVEHVRRRRHRPAWPVRRWPRRTSTATRVLVGIVWFACIIGLGLWLKLRQRRLPEPRSASYNLRAVRSPAARSLFRPARRSPAAPSVAIPSDDRSDIRGQWQRHPWQPSRCPARCAATERGEPAPRRAVTYWCANGHAAELRLRRRGRRRRTPGTAPAAGCRPVRTRRTRRRAPRTEPYKTHLAYVKERRTEEDGEAILAEALAALRQRRGRPSLTAFGGGATLTRVTKGPVPAAQRRLRSRAGTSAAAARSSSHSVRATPCTPAAGSCIGPAPASAMPTARALSAPAGDQPDLLGRVDRRQGQGDPDRRRLRAAAHRATGRVSCAHRVLGEDRRDVPVLADARASARRRRQRGVPGRGARPARRRTRRRRPPGRRRPGRRTAGIGCTRAGSSGTASSSAARAWVSLRSGSPAGRNRSSPHQTSTRDQSTASRAGRSRDRPVAPPRRSGRR